MFTFGCLFLHTFLLGLIPQDWAFEFAGFPLVFGNKVTGLFPFILLFFLLLLCACNMP